MNEEEIKKIKREIFSELGKKSGEKRKKKYGNFGKLMAKIKAERKRKLIENLSTV